jgi:hypothetical protein
MRALIGVALLAAAACGEPPTPPKCPEPKPPGLDLPEETPEDVARTYVRSVSEAELDNAADIVDARAVVFESGKDRGLWRDYREQVLAPTLGKYESFEIWSGEATTIYGADKSMAVVTLPIEYQVTYLEGGKKQSSGSVTFGVQLVEGKYKIMHLHWSAFEVTPE